MQKQIFGSNWRASSHIDLEYTTDLDGFVRARTQCCSLVMGSLFHCYWLLPVGI